MTANTGRTSSKFVKVLIDDSGGNLREIPVDSINGLGLTYDEQDLTAFMDAVKGALPGIPSFSCTIGGPFDTTANTGSHTVLSGVSGGTTPLSFDVRIGILHTWEAGEPQFGITSSSTAGVLVRDYQVDLSSMKYSATIYMFPGSSAPGWGTAAES
jgi:hypothetical protein